MAEVSYNWQNWTLKHDLLAWNVGASGNSLLGWRGRSGRQWFVRGAFDVPGRHETSTSGGGDTKPPHRPIVMSRQSWCAQKTESIMSEVANVTAWAVQPGVAPELFPELPVHTAMQHLKPGESRLWSWKRLEIWLIKPSVWHNVLHCLYHTWLRTSWLSDLRKKIIITSVKHLRAELEFDTW